MEVGKCEGGLLFPLPFIPPPTHTLLGAELTLSFSQPKSSKSFVRDAWVSTALLALVVF